MEERTRVTKSRETAILRGTIQGTGVNFMQEVIPGMVILDHVENDRFTL